MTRAATYQRSHAQTLAFLIFSQVWVAEVFSTLRARPAPALRLFPRLHLLALLLFLLYLLSFPLGFSYLAFACWSAHAPRVPRALRLACLARPAPCVSRAPRAPRPAPLTSSFAYKPPHPLPPPGPRRERGHPLACPSHSVVRTTHSMA